jgi:hypothetical protein
MPGQVFKALHQLWLARNQADEYVGTLVNAYLAEDGVALGVKSGSAYVDIGTLNGYRAAIGLLAEMERGSSDGATTGLGWPAGRQRSRPANQQGIIA